MKNHQLSHILMYLKDFLTLADSFKLLLRWSGIHWVITGNARKVMSAGIVAGEREDHKPWNRAPLALM